VADGLKRGTKTDWPRSVIRGWWDWNEAVVRWDERWLYIEDGPPDVRAIELVTRRSGACVRWALGWSFSREGEDPEFDDGLRVAAPVSSEESNVGR
jgi:hypothetical protein